MLRVLELMMTQMLCWMVTIIGYINGDRSYKNNVRKLSIDEILISCAKLISFLYVYNEPKKEIILDFEANQAGCCKWT